MDTPAGDALAIFERHDAGILNLVRAADIYATHLVARLRKVPVDPQIVEAVMEHRKISGLVFLAMSYSTTEREMLAQEGHLREIGQQIVVASYTAFEAYLVNKFGEYFRFRQSGADTRTTEASLVHFRRAVARSLDQARSVYRDVLDIDIRWFEIDTIYTTKDCAFAPDGTWDGLQLLSKTRNDIVHANDVTYRIGTLTDAWYPFEFIRNYVHLFDANFDGWIYEGRAFRLIDRYSERRRRGDYLPGEYPARER